MKKLQDFMKLHSRILGLSILTLVLFSLFSTGLFIGKTYFGESKVINQVSYSSATPTPLVTIVKEYVGFTPAPTTTPSQLRPVTYKNYSDEFISFKYPSFFDSYSVSEWKHPYTGEDAHTVTFKTEFMSLNISRNAYGEYLGVCTRPETDKEDILVGKYIANQFIFYRAVENNDCDTKEGSFHTSISREKNKGLSADYSIVMWPEGNYDMEFKDVYLEVAKSLVIKK